MIRTIAILLVAPAAVVVTTIRALAVAQDETAIRVEVASVKATGRKDGPIVFTDPPDGFSAQNTTVRELLHESDFGHSWITWRRDLYYQVAPKLFLV